MWCLQCGQLYVAQAANGVLLITSRTPFMVNWTMDHEQGVRSFPFSSLNVFVRKYVLERAKCPFHQGLENLFMWAAHCKGSWILPKPTFIQGDGCCDAFSLHTIDRRQLQSEVFFFPEHTEQLHCCPSFAWLIYKTKLRILFDFVFFT